MGGSCCRRQHQAADVGSASSTGAVWGAAAKSGAAAASDAAGRGFQSCQAGSLPGAGPTGLRCCRYSYVAAHARCGSPAVLSKSGFGERGRTILCSLRLECHCAVHQAHGLLAHVCHILVQAVRCWYPVPFRWRSWRGAGGMLSGSVSTQL